MQKAGDSLAIYMYLYMDIHVCLMDRDGRYL